MEYSVGSKETLALNYGDETICVDVYVGETFAIVKGKHEGLINKIQAAPDMYEALVEALSQLEDLISRSENDCDWHHEALQAGYKALAKAKGK